MRHLTAALVTMLLAVGLLALPAPAQELAEERFEVKKEAYTYTSGDRRDPFLSIIFASKKVQEKKRPKGLVPLEDYDLSQVRLLGIIRDQKRHVALVGLPDGKFYTIREGMSLGLHSGKIQRITDDRIVVREYIRDYKGKLKPQDTVLRLRKEEEE